MAQPKFSNKEEFINKKVKEKGFAVKLLVSMSSLDKKFCLLLRRFWDI